MQNKQQLPFLTLLLMISFASVNAVLFTPALPNIANFFLISVDQTQQTITWFLIAYAFGQLIYGPIANRFGRKKALYFGISLQIISSLICAFSGIIHQYYFLIIGRFLLALGSGVGLKMAFTLVNECYEAKIASQKTSYLLLAFAITPALGVALGGFLNSYFGWQSCFYAGAIYGLILFFLVMQLPETQNLLKYDALKINILVSGYLKQFKNMHLISGGLMMGCATSFIYIFATLAPFIVINLLGFKSTEYGIANLLPAVGLIFGSLSSAQLTKELSLLKCILSGMIISLIGVFIMLSTVLMHFSAINSIFLPMMIIYFGLSFIIANASTVAMTYSSDKANASAVMNFINMGFATIAVLSMGFFHVSVILLPSVYIILSLIMMGIYKLTLSSSHAS